MKNILIRAGISPFDTFNAAEMIVRNSIGGNVGNLVYAYSVFRTLMTEETTITPDYYRINPADAEQINKKYDMYIIPLADAFREDFVPSLRKYTQLIKKLTIPVVVIGVGLRAPFEPKLNEGFPFDQDVKAFVSAVLERSKMIGVRGEITAKYLSRLGFREGVDHTVIGCPSMYAFGRELKIRETNITSESMVTVNSSRLSPKHVLDFITRSMKEFPNHYFIPQWRKEMILTYAGAPALAKPADNYPVSMEDPAYQNDRVRFFLNVPTWLDFLKQADLSFGARLHGNIAATIAGTPSLLLPKDARMRELAEYHQLTHVMANEITAQTKLSELIETLDFHQPEKRQAQNFDHFISFLNKNELDHIYKEKMIPDTVPFDEKLSSTKLLPPVTTVSGCSSTETAKRWEALMALENAKKEKTIKDLKNKVKKYQGTLNRKSVRFALKTANMLSVK
ncbi:polysaccharide pyruvyl transferase family protein [Bacillus halotolerans]|uniref:polysaccharide pyruvyl transferase family protein n=1 Tax=Bacillus halotolerans TaxID=260554 RepID=UPI000FD7F2D4|nr:polysaccharide pyruvyl transferase family protein [Bacillus halotolerans]AZV49451.1 polysaccharide pyruvyl transferase [Bacillus halotolerans]MEC3637408.1 polysaccharide pyruvyl transferase family protein [Bacillus halotolerans]UTL76672.1 polysaccharide pyruvyl transferase family protein [Bacillus halotolerans]WJE43092.1 polysaccharide pyruvyl transferase family protein [Bacillus halotolerans]WPC80660.1 polysaccharide pyruvyl transferase family protein [Bacillus halotolerans]